MQEDNVHIMQNEGKEMNLRCHRDAAHEIVQIFDLEGRVLPFNPQKRCLIWLDQVWYF